MDILLTGGLGHIGSQIYYCLRDNGHNPIVADSQTYNPTQRDVKLCTGDIGSRDFILQIFRENPLIEMCVHCAELFSHTVLSVHEPFEYYQGNVVKSMAFFKTLKEVGLKKIIFASSSAIYAEVAGQVVTELSPVSPNSPYSRAKYMTELILSDFCEAYGMNGVVMRNFSPVGVDPDFRSFKNCVRTNSILHNLIEVMEGRRPHFEIYGGDWDTRDGTGIRDFIHIWDLAQAHVAAVNNFDRVIGVAKEQLVPVITMNIGSGKGTTIREFISAFENITGERIKSVVVDKRPGESSGVYADIKRATSILDWQPTLPIEEAIIGAIALAERNR